MKEYLVEWSIELSAESPEDAAKLALAIQRDPNSTATVFIVIDTGAAWENVHIDAAKC